MKQLIAVVFFFMAIMIMPQVANAQPVPGAHYEYYCYHVLWPIPHSKCEYRLVRHYRFVPPPPRRYSPAPPPGYRPGPWPNHYRPGHHPPPRR